MEFESLHFSAHGKLMLFGEYVVMRCVPALAFPTALGQTLDVVPADEYTWKSYETGKLWF